MVTSGNWPMFSAEMLSWILGARRFISIARICDARTPVTVTSSNSSAFLTWGEGVVGPPCCAGSGAAVFSAGAFDARADDAAASNAMEMAIDRGCLRYTFDTAFPSRLLSSGPQMPYRSWQKCTDHERHTASRSIDISSQNSVYLFGRLTNQSRMMCA